MPPRRFARTGGASPARCPPAGSAVRRLGDTGSEPSGSFACDTAWSSPEQASRAPPSVAGSPPSRSPVGSDRWRLTGSLCRSGNLNNTLIDKQNWIAASEKTGGRPGQPSCGACQAISISSQISNDPRLRRAALAIVLGPMAHQWLDRRTSSLCGSGRARACSCHPSNRLDS